MPRRPRPIATFTLAALIAALLTACGGPTDPTGTPDPTGPGEDDPEPYWEMTVASGDDEPFEVTGTAVANASPNVIVLGDSDPAGWTVSFTITGDLPIGIPYFTDNDDLLNGTVGTPSGSCVATPATNHALPSFVTLAPTDGGVPVGLGTIFVDGGCGSFADETSFMVGFGVQ